MDELLQEIKRLQSDLAAAQAALLEYAERSADGNLRDKHAPALAVILAGLDALIAKERADAP